MMTILKKSADKSIMFSIHCLTKFCNYYYTKEIYFPKFILNFQKIVQ